MKCERCGCDINPVIGFCPVCKKQEELLQYNITVQNKKKRNIFLVLIGILLVAFFILFAINVGNSNKDKTVENSEQVEEIPEQPPKEETPVVPEQPPKEETPVVPEEPPKEETPVVPEEPPKEETPVVPEEPPKEETPVVPEEPPKEETPVVPEQPPKEETPVVPEQPPKEETPVVPTPPVTGTGGVTDSVDKDNAQIKPEITNPQNNRSVIHFISTGSSDAFLIESNGTYGLVDASNPYNDNTLQSISFRAHTVMSVVDYLDSLGVKYLDYVIATHSHSDHIGGMPVIAKKYINSSTKYYYREYDGANDGKLLWDNEGYYDRAIAAVKEKGAIMIEVTNSNTALKYGNFELTLLNTDKSVETEENYNAIGVLVKSNGVKVFLSSDIEASDAEKIMSQIGKVDVLKLNHHGYSGASYNYVSTLRPNYVIISNENIPLFANAPIAYMKEKFNTISYYTGSVAGAIKLHITGDRYYFENSGSPVSLSMTDWVDWSGKWVYLTEGKLTKGWLLLKNQWYYLNEDGIMLTEWQFLNWSGGNDWFYFEPVNGDMLVGWQYLDWSGGTNWFYFDLVNGNMYHDGCFTIDGKQYCFDSNGVCYKGR